ncbi:MAG: protein kinase [Phycisphaerales bacterium]|nr:protein kinase [Phycisphaerales bacterium]
MSSAESEARAGEEEEFGACPPDEVIDLIAGGGAATSEVAAHLEICARCRAEIAAVRAGEQFLSGYLGPARAEEARENELDISPDLLPGYRMLSLIHSGGQGVVYKAVQETTGRTVAVKMLLSGRFATPSQRRRFEREAEVAASLDHPGIVRIFDSREVRGGRHALIMEYVEGVPLDGWVPTVRSDRERLRVWIAMFVEIADAVEHAHRNGVIHRDLKPANVLVDGHDRARVVDFGVARPIRPGGGEKGAAITQAGEFAGSLEYASPEQVLEASDTGQGIRADARSDVYSLGVMLYRCVCGKHPYPTDGSIIEVVRTIVEIAPVRPSVADRTIDLDLETIMLLALHKDRARRYQTAGALAADLRRYLAGDAIEARRDSGLYVLRKTARKYRAPIAAAGVLLAALAAVPVLIVIASAETEQRKRFVEYYREVRTAGTIAEGRLATQQRRGPWGETMIWTGLLDTFAARPGAGATKNDPGIMDPEKMRETAVWALREVYARDPCIHTAQIGSGVRAAVACSVPPAELRWVNAEGRLLRAPMTSLDKPIVTDGRVGVEERCGFGGSGGSLAVWGADGLGVLDAKTGASRARFASARIGRAGAAVSPGDDAVVWVDPDGRVWRAALAGGETAALSGAPRGIATIGWGRAGLVALGQHGELWLVDAETGAALAHRSLSPGAWLGERGGDEKIQLVQSRDGSLIGVAKGADAWFVPVKAAGQRAEASVQPVPEMGEPVLIDTATPGATIALLSGGPGLGARALSGGERPRVMIWTVRDGREAGDLMGHEKPISLVLACDDAVGTGNGRPSAITIDAGGVARVWSLGATTVVNSQESSATPAIVGVGWENATTLRSWTADGMESRWSAAGVRRPDAAQPRLGDPPARLSAVSLHAGTGRIAAGFEDGRLEILDDQTGRVDCRVSWSGTGGPRGLSWSDDGTKLGAFDGGGGVWWWSVGGAEGAGGRAVLISQAAPDMERVGRVGGLVFGRDDQTLIVSGSRGTLASYEQSSGAFVFSHPIRDNPLGPMGTCATDFFHAVMADRKVVILDDMVFGAVVSWVERPDFGARESRARKATCMAVSPDGRHAAIGHDNGEVGVWDLWSPDASLVGNLEYRLSQRQPYEDAIDAEAVRAWFRERFEHAYPAER